MESIVTDAMKSEQIFIPFHLQVYLNVISANIFLIPKLKFCWMETLTLFDIINQEIADPV